MGKAQDHFNKTGRILLGSGSHQKAAAQNNSPWGFFSRARARVVERWESSSPSYPGLGPHTGHRFNGPYYDFEHDDVDKQAMFEAFNDYLAQAGYSISYNDFLTMFEAEERKRHFRG